MPKTAGVIREKIKLLFAEIATRSFLIALQIVKSFLFALGRFLRKTVTAFLKTFPLQTVKGFLFGPGRFLRKTIMAVLKTFPLQTVESFRFAPGCFLWKTVMTIMKTLA